MKKKRVLFITQEMNPYIEESEIAKIARNLPQGIQQRGKEIRTFMPRFGSINERRNQLHEVIRLSGMNLIINDNDHPLIIKVASIQAARMQVYFIDNDEFFSRKFGLIDKSGEFFEDNAERSIFYCRGVLETVKKLGWTPDIIHCHGWMTGLVPLFVKRAFAEDPNFANSKIVTSLYNEKNTTAFDPMMGHKAVIDGVDIPDVDGLVNPTVSNINKFAADWSDAVIYGSSNLDDDLKAHVEKLDIPVLSEFDRENYVEDFDNFYDLVLEGAEVNAE
jgi:starch synthase